MSAVVDAATETDRAAVVRSFHDAFGEGDLAGACAHLHDECLIDEAGGLPFSGLFHGPKGFAEFAGQVSRYLTRSGVTGRFANTQTGVAGEVSVTFKSNATGHELETRILEMYSVENGKITAMDIYHKDPAKVRELIEGGIPAGDAQLGLDYHGIIPEAGGPVAQPSDEHIEVVREFHTRFGVGNLDGAYAMMDPACRLDEARGLPYSGVFIGPEGFGQLLARMTADLDHEVRYREVLSTPNFVLLRIVVAFTSLNTRRQTFSKLLETYTVENGAITAIDVYYKNPAAIRELAEQG